MKFFTIKKRPETDYKNLLEIYAKMGTQSFSGLSNGDKKEIVAAFLEEDDHEDDVINMLIDLKNTGALSEFMYEGIKSKDLGEIISNILMTGDHIKQINSDIDEAFGDYMMSLDGYESTDDELRHADNRERSVGLDKVKHQRMGI